jgi:hypothetical protein
MPLTIAISPGNIFEIYSEAIGKNMAVGGVEDVSD